ncbi:MAG: MATE family efflux transporter [Polaribacter sp.]|uniref:MATE family efflux transporter n=1 Tax=Polaribacter sp. TaxID=1920175 RepID=UPI002F3521AE
MDRKKIIFKNVSLGVLFKVLNMCIVFTTIPILLNYLEKEQYGIWVTIFSLVNIVFFVDAGIGNGLKTRLTEALSLKDFKLAKTYISTAYISISSISIIIFIIAVVLIFNFNLQELFNTRVLSNIELQKILLITLILIVIGFVLNLYKSFYYASQQASKVELAMLIYQILILSTITVLLNFFPRNLMLIALVYGIANIVVGLIFTVLFFKKNKNIIPSIKFFSKSKVNDLMGLSLAFFVIQLCMIVIFSTDNLIITKLLGPSEVTNYDVVFRLFQVVITFSVIMQDPFWALYTDAYQKKDFNWIRKTIIKLNKLFMLFIFLVLILFFISKPIINLWIQRDLLISKSLLLFMSLFVLVRVYGAIYMMFLNAIGKVKLQMWLFIFGAIINIPISIYLVEEYNLGSSGVILGTVFSILGMSIILPIQTFKILKNNEFN